MMDGGRAMAMFDPTAVKLRTNSASVSDLSAKKRRKALLNDWNLYLYLHPFYFRYSSYMIGVKLLTFY